MGEAIGRCRPPGEPPGQLGDVAGGVGRAARARPESYMPPSYAFLTKSERLIYTKNKRLYSQQYVFFFYLPELNQSDNFYH